MFVKKIANHNNKARIDKSTVIKRVDGSVGYVYTDRGYAGTREGTSRLPITPLAGCSSLT